MAVLSIRMGISESYAPFPPPMFFDILACLIVMLPLILGLYIMFLEPQVCWRTHQTLVSKFSTLPLLVPLD